MKEARLELEFRRPHKKQVHVAVERAASRRKERYPERILSLFLKDGSRVESGHSLFNVAEYATWRARSAHNSTKQYFSCTCNSLSRATGEHLRQIRRKARVQSAAGVMKELLINNQPRRLQSNRF